MNYIMKELLSTREAADKLGVSLLTLQRHLSAGTVYAPPLRKIGGVTVTGCGHTVDVERVRKILATVKPGEKRRRKETGRAGASTPTRP